MKPLSWEVNEGPRPEHPELCAQDLGGRKNLDDILMTLVESWVVCTLDKINKLVMA